jgi:dihydroxy-acid dehydratase
MLHGECLTVAGKNVAQILEETPEGDRAVIRTVEEPLAKADGIQVLYGNLAPNGALVKTSAVPKDVWVFQGTAKVFEGEDACYAAFREMKIKEGDAVIVRYEGPKGGPGMKELHRITEIIKGIPNTAVITDGRFSGASGGLSIGYLCPEAAEGGPIALVRDGDRILVDLPKGSLMLDVPEEELARRREAWTPHRWQEEKGLLGRYGRMVGTAREGAIFK